MSDYEDRLTPENGSICLNTMENNSKIESSESWSGELEKGYGPKEAEIIEREIIGVLQNDDIKELRKIIEKFGRRALFQNLVKNNNLSTKQI